MPGIFWLMTADKGWPELFSDANRWRSLITIPIVILACWIPAFLFWFYFSPTDFGDCGEPPPFAKRHSPVEAVFIGKVVFVGGPSRFPRMGSWAVMRVEREYWGLPKLGSHLVIFRGFGLYEGEVGEYFVQAHRSLGLISHFFPIVEPGNCDRTRPLRLAEPELRVLRDGAPKSGVRIVGLVTRGIWLGPPAAGIGVSIQGPDGTTVLTTDQSGTYDIAGLPPGRYSIGMNNDPRPSFRDFAELEAGDIWGPTLMVDSKLGRCNGFDCK